MTEDPTINEAANAPLATIGVIADTHIPDRVSAMHPGILPALKAAGVQHILHAGDICTARVLEELRQAAPVTAVRGNRDILAGRLPDSQQLEFGGVKVMLVHGHGGLVTYLWDKCQWLVFGYRLERYLDLLRQSSQAANVVIFGHTHHPETRWENGKLLFNPGSASFGMQGEPPTFGLLRIYPGGRVQAEILPLMGYMIEKRKWVAV